MQNRLNHLREILNEKKLNAVLISSPQIISYLTGYHGFSNVEREAFLLITTTNNYLITDARYTEATMSHVPHFTTIERNHEQTVSVLLQKFLQKEKSTALGFESTNITVSEYTSLKKAGVRLVPVDLRSLQIIKDELEITNIKMAAEIANAALQKIKHTILSGVTEKEVANTLEAEMRKQNADISFPTIVAFGKNAAIPHHMTGETKLKKNDLVLIDFGAKWNGYCSDCTRTFFVGDVPKDWKKAYQTVENAQKLAKEYIEMQLKNNNQVLAKESDKVTREYIISEGYPSIPHSLGHGIGLQVHEAPSLSPNSKDILTDGMVFSIEPGIYLPGEMGVRIEDLFAIHGSTLMQLT